MPDRQSYLDDVTAVVLDAIRVQGPDLLMPSPTTICDRYRTRRTWTWRLRQAETDLGWLWQDGHGYIARVPDLPFPFEKD